MWLPMKNVCTSTVSEKKQNEERTEEGKVDASK